MNKMYMVYVYYIYIYCIKVTRKVLRCPMMFLMFLRVCHVFRFHRVSGRINDYPTMESLHALHRIVSAPLRTLEGSKV